MATLYTQSEKNVRRTWFYLFLFSALIALIGYSVSYFYGSWAFFWIGLGISVLSSFVSYWFSDKIVLSLTGAKKVEKDDFPELIRVVENLSITAGLPTPEVRVIESPALNAFATGRNPKNSVVVVTTGLLERLERVELEGVIAHELSHIGNRDILLASLVVVLVGLVLRLVHFFYRIGFRGSRKKEGGSLLLFVLGLFALILAPILAQLLRFAISRKREFLADADGALLTRYPEGLANALEKISKDPCPLRTADISTAHLFIGDPLKKRAKNKKSFFVKLFSSHPPAEERIRALREMEV